jgi:CheY-like chemotaxis protein
VQPLADRHHKRLVRQAGAACVAAIHPLIFRQAMLHLLNSAILHTRGDEVAVAVDCEGRHVRICIRSGGAAGGAAGGAGAETDGEEALVREMLRVWRCTLHTGGHDDCWEAELRCGRLREQVVLVIDDHAETAALLMRSLEGTRYRVIATQEPQRGLDLAVERQPCLILLDVMMPAMDGWEVLTRLKQHESTASIPVVVCTVLDQSELALSLGADAFVRKPITREALLALLDAQGVREPAREPAPR